MAGIEKVCEYSGEYGYGEMYAWKRNLIQIMPKYRKLFKGCNAVLEIEKKPDSVYLGGAWMSGLDEVLTIPYQKRKKWLNKFRQNLWWRRSNKDRLAFSYNYTLVVSNPELQGEVEGRLLNWSTNKRTVIRKLKRLTGNYKLKVKYVKEC